MARRDEERESWHRETAQRIARIRGPAWQVADIIAALDEAYARGRADALDDEAACTDCLEHCAERAGAGS